ncbi:MAG: quinone oxidoreductase [Chloroflexota bacterium]
MRAIRVHNYGGPEALSFDEVPAPQPGAGEVLVRVSAIGVDFIDVYHRIGRYALPLPVTPGVEVAGRVEAVGSGVTEFRAGHRVACFLNNGGYAEYVSAAASRVIPLPDGVDERSAAASLVQGMTAQILVDEVYPLKPGDTCLVHAAAGGVGLLLTQLAKKRGARVIATVSTDAKAQLAREAGADDVILYTQADFEIETKQLTNGAGVNVAYDSVGKTTFEKGLNVLKPRGMMVLYGSSSGPAPLLDPNSLGGKGSLFVTRPSIYHYIAQREALLKSAGSVFKWIASGELNLRIERTYLLADAAQAHRDLEGRVTTGKLLLLP